MIIDVSSVIPAIAFILYVFFAVFGFMQYNKDRFYWSFQLYMIFFAIWSFGSMMMHLNSGLFTPLFWNKVMLVGLLSAPFPLVHFILDIMNINNRMIRKFSRYSYVFILLLLVLNLQERIVTDVWFTNVSEFSYTLGSGAVLAYSISYIYLLLTLMIIFVGRKKIKAREYGKNIYLPLIGVLIMLIGILTNLMPNLGKYPIDVFAATINALLLFYTIYKYKLISYSRIGLSIMFSTILAVVASFSYFLIIYVISLFSENIITFDIAALSMILGIATVIIIHPMKNLLSYFIDSVIIPKRHPYQATIKNLSHRLTTIVDLNELGEEVVKSLSVGMKTNWVLFAVTDTADDTEHFRLIANNKCETNIQTGAEFQFTFTRDIEKKLLVSQKENTASILYAKPDEQKISVSPQIPDADVIIPLVFRNKTAGYILIGFDLNKVLITNIELEALEILAAQCALSLKNALTFEQLRKQGTELTMSNNKLEAIFNGIASPVCMIDIDYTIKEVNSAAVSIFGKQREAMIGRKCYRTFFGRNLPCSFCKGLDCIHSGVMQENEADVIDKTFSFQFHNVKVTHASKGQFIEIINDVTNRRICRKTSSGLRRWPGSVPLQPASHMS